MIRPLSKQLGKYSSSELSVRCLAAAHTHSHTTHTHIQGARCDFLEIAAMCAKINFFDTPHKMLSTAQDSRQHRQGERERGGCLIDRCSMPQMRHMAMSSSTCQLSFSLSLSLSSSASYIAEKSSSVFSFLGLFLFLFTHCELFIIYLAPLMHPLCCLPS